MNGAENQPHVLENPAHANEASTLDRIEVTGSRISYRDLLDTPAISITKRGDYLSQTITLVNDTRDEASRRREIHATIEKLIARAGTTYSVLHGYTYPITLSRANADVELQDDSKRPDVSRVVLQVKLSLSDATTDGAAQIRSLRQFVGDTPKIGRIEIDLSDDTALGMNKPERYRYELIEAIAADSLKIRESIGAGCKVDLDGLNSRIEWERVGPIELLLYVPYTMTVRGCADRVGDFCGDQNARDSDALRSDDRRSCFAPLSHRAGQAQHHGPNCGSPGRHVWHLRLQADYDVLAFADSDSMLYPHQRRRRL